MILAAIIFWFCAAVCAYVYLGYPLLLFVISRLRRRAVHHGDAFPSVTIIVPAHNEAAVLQKKIDNTLALIYPGRREVIIASDGSTDRTVEIGRRYSDRVRVLDLDRLGKANALNTGAREANGHVLVLTDANVMLEEGALVHLVRPFSDPDVGGVCGNKRVRVLVTGDATGEGENLYVRYDQWQKSLESDIGSVFAADGALYAVRKSLFIPIQDPAQADDIAISSRVVLQGKRLIYEPKAVGWEEAPSEGAAEFSRKIRVTNHSVRALLNLGPQLWKSGFYSVELLSHKLLRHLVPFFLLPMLVSNYLLATGSDFYFFLLMAQIAIYTLAAAGMVLRATPAGGVKVFSIPYYFCMVNAAAFLGVLSIAQKKRVQAWTPRGGVKHGG